MKKNSAWAGVYMALVLVLLYLPILVVVLFSFNGNPGRTANFHFEGFSLQWYQALFDPATGYGQPLRTSLMVALWSAWTGPWSRPRATWAPAPRAPFLPSPCP